MASTKDRYEAGRWLAGRYAAGKWRGEGVTPVVPDTIPTTGWTPEPLKSVFRAEVAHVIFNADSSRLVFRTEK